MRLGWRWVCVESIDLRVLFKGERQKAKPMGWIVPHPLQLQPEAPSAFALLFVSYKLLISVVSVSVCMSSCYQSKPFKISN